MTTRRPSSPSLNLGNAVGGASHRRVLEGDMGRPSSPLASPLGDRSRLLARAHTSLAGSMPSSGMIPAFEKSSGLTPAVLAPRHSMASLFDGKRELDGDNDLYNLNASNVRSSISSMSSTRGVQAKRDKAAVQVCVRIRPLEVAGGEKHAREQHEDAVQYQNKYGWRYDSRSIAPQSGAGADSSEGASFTFDNIFPPMTTTESIYKQVLSEIVQSTVEGYNGCIFAYGQTSSGKTFTMTGTRSSPGVIPQATAEVFSHVKSYPDREFFFRLSYIEIYNEVVIDLLDPTKTGLQIRSSDASSVVKIVGVTEKVVTSAAEVLATVVMGETHRSVGSTDMNEKSSRSHTIFRLVIESKLKDVHSGAGPEYRVSSLNLVDLAGSESASKSGVVGQRRTEGSYINKSLLTLATVIQRLITASGHVPYRDSKLTRILEPALGGNSRTAIICTVTPAAHHFGESMNTLKFAARAKKMKNKPILNDINVSSATVSAEDLPLLKRYRDEIEALRKEKEQLEQMNLQQQAEVEHEKGQLEEMKTLLLHKIERYESMIVDLDSVNRTTTAAQNAKNPARYKGAKRRGGEQVFGKLKSHVLELQHRLNDKVVDINRQVALASNESVGRERDLKEFQKAVHEGQRDGDEGQHLMLVNHVVKALKEQVKLEGSILAQLIGDIKADLQMLEAVQEDFKSLEIALRTRDLKEKGLNNILKGLHHQVSEKNTLLAVLTSENRDLHTAVSGKERENKMLLEQLYDFADQLQGKEQELSRHREEVYRLEGARLQQQARVADAEALLGSLQSSYPFSGGSSGKGGNKHAPPPPAPPVPSASLSKQELIESNTNLKHDLQRMKQQNNTQLLQMQGMQNQLRAKTQEVFTTTELAVQKGKESEQRRGEVDALDAQLAALADKYEDKCSLCEAQEEEMERLRRHLVTKEKRIDMLLEVIESTEGCASNQEVKEVCARMQEEQVKTWGDAQKELEREQSTRRAMQDKHRAEVSRLQAKLAEAARRERESSREREVQRAKEDVVRRLEGVLERGVLDVLQDGESGPPAHASSLKADRELLESLKADKAKLQESREAEQRKSDKLVATVEELQKKNNKLMSALMVHSTQINGDKCREEDSEIQAVADAKFDDYLNLTTGVAEHLRDEFVMDMIHEYEERLYLLQRCFIQQLKDFQ